MRIQLALLASCLTSSFLSDVAVAERPVITIGPNKDNTLYEDPGGVISNGSGEFFFAGLNNELEKRRAVIFFDVAAWIPRSATITAATLSLYLSRTQTGDAEVSIHRLTADWGEGASDAGEGGGAGTVATEGDATWRHRFFDTVFWTNEGGDFEEPPTGSAIVGMTTGTIHTWGSSPAMVDVVQEWLEDPESNFGWILVGDESARSTKRFNSRENKDRSTRPVLEIEFDPAPISSPDLNMDGRVDGIDLNIFLDQSRGSGD